MNGERVEGEGLYGVCGHLELHANRIGPATRITHTRLHSNEARVALYNSRPPTDPRERPLNESFYLCTEFARHFL